MDSYLRGLTNVLFMCFLYLNMHQIIPLTLSSNAESAAFAPSPIEIIICL